MNETKNVGTSKTVIANALFALVVALIPGAKEFVVENPSASIIGFSLVNILLRFLTKKGIHLVAPPRELRFLQIMV